jgi:hypothetical protein
MLMLLFSCSCVDICGFDSTSIFSCSSCWSTRTPVQ